jgi:hypothetical protein
MAWHLFGLDARIVTKGRLVFAAIGIRHCRSKRTSDRTKELQAADGRITDVKA